MQINDRTFLVTGGASGLGGATAAALLERGAHVVVADRAGTAPAGAVLEFHAWNLHFAPIHARQGQGFATLVYLPRGTNEPLPFGVEKRGEGRLLFAVNKWLLAHPQAAGLLAQGAYAGLTGSDLTVTPV